MKHKYVLALTFTFGLAALAVHHGGLVKAAPTRTQTKPAAQPAPTRNPAPTRVVKHPGGPKFDEMNEEADRREQAEKAEQERRRREAEAQLAAAKAKHDELTKSSKARVERLRVQAKAQQPTAPVRKQPAQVARKPAVSRTLKRKDASGKHEFEVRLEASGWVDPRLLDYLEGNLELTSYRQTPGRAEEPAAWQQTSKPDETANEISVRLRALSAGTDVKQFAWSWPSGFELVRPGVLRARPELAEGFSKASAQTKKALILAPGTGPAASQKAASKTSVPGDFTSVELKVACRASDKGTAMAPKPLRQVRVEMGAASGKTDDDGVVTLQGKFANSVQVVNVVYDSQVESHKVTSGLRVMGEVPSDVRREARAGKPRGASKAGKLLLEDVVLESVDCETWRLGEQALTRYHELVGKSPPAGKLWIKRWTVDWGGTPYTFYDHVVLTQQWIHKGAYREESWRRSTMHHELGHSVRHVADGDVHHWNWDNFRWAYAREHSGCEVFNTQYAFNEGWAGYWEAIANKTKPAGCIDGPNDPAHGPDARTPAQRAKFVDWVENMVSDRLYKLSAGLETSVCSSSDQRKSCAARKMIEVLERHPGQVHSLWDFETRYCQLHHTNNSLCRSRGVPTRAAPASCPPGYTDDGATCRLHQVIAKESYTRGVGEAPTGCGSKRYEDGLCYQPCKTGYSGVAHLCWEHCPSGYRDDGAFCAKPAPYGRGAGFPWQFGDGLNLDNATKRCEKAHGAGKCEVWGAIVYPKCRAGFHNAGCCICSPNCPSGMTDIGVSCAKRVYDRGVGTVPTACTGGKQYQDGLCYQPCRAGFHGVGPVCWGQCPAGFSDQGALCSRPAVAAILVKY